MNMMKGFYRSLYLILIPLVILVFIPDKSSAPAASNPQDSGNFVANQLIIKVKPGVNENTLQSILNQNGLSRTRFLSNLNLMLVNLPSGFSLDTVKGVLSRNSNFEYVEKNYIRHALLVPNDQYYSLQYHHPKIGDPQAWDIETGDPSVVIAVIDTGVQSTHPDLSGKVLTGSNFVGSVSTTNTNDDNGHGTGVSGTAAADSNNSIGVAGVCWGCLILPVKVLDSSGSGTEFDVIEGINFVANYAAQNPGKKVIINMSLGGPCSSGTSEEDAINNAWNNGVVIVAAAGNNGNTNPVCPAAKPNVLAVSATDENDKLASFSSYGSFVGVSAPGVNIAATWGNSGYVYASGTSFSSPITAGVVGLIWSINPNLTNLQVVQLIEDTADDIGDQGNDIKFGHGRVNAYTAVQAAKGTFDPTPTPTPTPAPTPTPIPTPTHADTTPPKIQITQPGNGARISGNVTIKASASDNVSVAKVYFYIDGKLLATDTSSPYSATWNSNTASKGLHTVRAIATDTSGNTASSQITVLK